MLQFQGPTSDLFGSPTLLPNPSQDDTLLDTVLVKQPACVSMWLLFTSPASPVSEQYPKQIQFVLLRIHTDLNSLAPASFPVKPVSYCWLLISSTGELED